MKPIAEMTGADVAELCQAFARDDAAVAGTLSPELLDAVAEAWGDRAGAKNHAVKVKPGREDAVLDVIMERAYPCESLAMSLSRLARAAGCMGFPYLSAFTARAAYNRFPQLTEKPYGIRRKPTGGDHGRERRRNAFAGEGRGNAGGGQVARVVRPQR